MKYAKRSHQPLGCITVSSVPAAMPCPCSVAYGRHSKPKAVSMHLHRVQGAVVGLPLLPAPLLLLLSGQTRGSLWKSESDPSPQLPLWFVRKGGSFQISWE